MELTDNINHLPWLSRKQTILPYAKQKITAFFAFMPFSNLTIEAIKVKLRH